MELNITEIDRMPSSNYNHNYWETNVPSKTENKKASKPFSYDDILSSLNMVVENGVLKKILLNKPRPQQPTQMQQQQPKPQRTLTPQEKRNLILQYRVKQVLEKKRVEQAKPSKMLFNAAPINPGNRMGRMFF